MQEDENKDSAEAVSETVEAEKPQPKKRTRKASSARLKLNSNAQNSDTDSSTTQVETPQPGLIIATSLTRPLNPPVHTVVYELDTQDRVQFTGSSWTFIDNLG